MTKGELETIRNIVARLKEANIGCARDQNDNCTDTGSNTGKIHGRVSASRIYIDTWLIGPLELLLPEGRDVDLAVSMSRR